MKDADKIRATPISDTHRIIRKIVDLIWDDLRHPFFGRPPDNDHLESYIYLSSDPEGIKPGPIMSPRQIILQDHPACVKYHLNITISDGIIRIDLDSVPGQSYISYSNWEFNLADPDSIEKVQNRLRCIVAAVHRK